jgi:hypothetical protein
MKRCKKTVPKSAWYSKSKKHMLSLNDGNYLYHMKNYSRSFLLGTVHKFIVVYCLQAFYFELGMIPKITKEKVK